jgi:hypothetical protein
LCEVDGELVLLHRYPPILVQVYGRPHPGPLPNCAASSLYTTRHLHRE